METNIFILVEKNEGKLLHVQEEKKKNAAIMTWRGERDDSQEWSPKVWMQILTGVWV